MSQDGKWSSPSSSPSAVSSLPLPVVAREEQRKRLFESSKPWKNMLHILFLLVLLCLMVFGHGEEGVSLFLCFREGFGEGCSGVDITLACVFVLLILLAICRCLRDCAKYCDGEEEGSQDGRLPSPHQEQRKKRTFRLFEPNKPWTKKNILSVLFLLVLLSLIFIAVARGRGEKDVFLFSCFEEGCSGLDITVACLSVLLILIVCSQVLLKCCYGEEEEEVQCDTV